MIINISTCRIFKYLKWSQRNAYYVSQMFSTSSICLEKSFQLVIAGGGAGGLSIASRFARHFGKGHVAIIEPSEIHYYQPLWTLVGAGLKSFNNSKKPMKSLIHKNAEWIKDKVVKFVPENNLVVTKYGDQISYEFLVVALGMQLDFKRVIGLPEAFDTPGVCSNYSADTVIKTRKALENFKKGNAIFTQPVNPIKCGGAPQKIMYLADDYFKKAGKRNSAQIHYNTALNVMFSAPKYAQVLTEIAKSKNVSVHFQHNLIEVNHQRKEAVFEKLNTPTKEKVAFKYEMLHVTPPMNPPQCIKDSSLCDHSGYLNVDKHTLQHVKYHNIFGIGDCTNCPTSKTAAAVASQNGVLKKNLMAAMNGNKLIDQYKGYTSCPLMTDFNRCVMAEFDYSLNPVETFPFDQGKPRYLMGIAKKNIIPALYWNLMLKGYWNGPHSLRKILSFGRAK